MVEDRPVRVQHRLAAILAADVAGYSRLMGLDETGTARALGENRAVIDLLVAKHGGRIVKTTGDGLLIEFPSVVAAVECAVAVQAVMAERNAGVPEDQRMLLRIGINLGEVLVQSDSDILGESVNVAARLEAIAEPGGIWVSGPAYDHVRGKVALEFADLGEQNLKKYRAPGAGLPHYRWREIKRIYRSLFGTFALDCRSPFHQSQWRFRAGIFRRWRHRELNHGLGLRIRQLCDRAQ